MLKYKKICKFKINDFVKYANALIIAPHIIPNLKLIDKKYKIKRFPQIRQIKFANDKKNYHFLNVAR